MATLHYLNKQLNTSTAQLHIVEALTANGATAVTATYTYPRAFAAAPKIIGVNHDNDGSIVASARSTATVLTFQIVGLAGNTDEVNVSVALEGVFAEGT